ncbi:MAG: glycerol-3-phosphate dehydrogenase [Clostridiales bacterium]|nr:MAG: glycerol-3-phosphate dehydrogenase [Clostridiales bacterium]
MAKVGVLGTGTWAMALSSVLLNKSNEVIMWGRDENQLKGLRKTGKNPKYNLSCTLKGNIKFTNCINDLENVDFLIIAISTQYIRTVLEQLKKLNENTIIINVSKGIEIETFKLVNEIVSDFYPKNEFVVLSGPSHAEEVADKLPTTIVSASLNKNARERVQNLFFCDYLRVYTNEDVIGVELTGALKNIIAIAAGISDGMGYGDNAKAALMTRGLLEIKRLGMKLGAKEMTFEGLTGVGDLIVTCTSKHSRNRRCGILIGEGFSISDAKTKIGMAVEGLSTVKAAYKLGLKHNIYMPIIEAMYKILYENIDINKLVVELMNNVPKSEVEKM